MTKHQDQPTKAEILAALVTGDASISSSMATVQRSHRFPIQTFAQIENMARMGGVPVSLIINELLRVGIEALYKELSPEVADDVSTMSKEQVERPSITEKIDAKGRNLGRKRKP